MLHIPDESKFFRHCVAEALYDNVAESCDELPFKRGDFLIVLEQNTGGLQGWWLCSFKGRQGICPGNRLQLVDDVCGCGQISKHTCNANGLRQKSERLSWHTYSQLNEISTSEKEFDRYACKYDAYANSGADEGIFKDEDHYRYDVPRCGQPIPARIAVASESNFDYARKCEREIGNEALMNGDYRKYDIPRRINSITPVSVTATFSSGFDSTISSTCDPPTVPFDTDRCTSDYDVPKSELISTRQLQPQSQCLPSQQGDEIGSSFTCYDVPLQITRKLPLELHSAVKNLERLQNEITNAINMLLSRSALLWRETDQDELEPKLTDIKEAVLQLRSTLRDLSEFGAGVLANALNAPDTGLVQKLRPLTKALFETNEVVQECAQLLEKCNWSAEALATNTRSSDNEGRKLSCGSNPLNQLVICAQSLTEDVRRFSSFVQGNATLLFKKNSADSDHPIANELNETNQDDDFLNVESQTVSNREDNARKSFDLPSRDAEKDSTLVLVKRSVEIDWNDQQILSLYAVECSAHLSHLTRAIDEFLNTVEHNQPPKVFLAHGKFVILSAHRLVHIGDAVHRNVSCAQINTHVGRLSDALSEALAAAVHEIKKAAVQFPSVTAVQQMVNSVASISYFARDLKMYLTIASQT